MRNVHIFWIVLTIVVTSSCERENTPNAQPQPVSDQDQRTQHNQLIDQQFTGNWKLVRIQTNEPIDVNLDGKLSTDLMAEIPVHADVVAQLKVNWSAQRRVFADGYIRTYPVTETGAGSAQYVVNGRTLYFDVNEDRNQLSLTDESETKVYPLRFNTPDEFSIDGIERTYYTNVGWKTIPTVSTYQRAK